MNLKAIATVLITIAAVTGLLWFSPYWSAASLAKAAQDGDTDVVADYVYVYGLRQSFRSQANAKRQADIKSGKATALETDWFTMERVLMRLVSPGGIVEILTPELQDLSASRVRIALRLVANDRVGWAGISAFHIPAGPQMTLIWDRHGASWRFGAIDVHAAE
jgi:hypothetical protein